MSSTRISTRKPGWPLRAFLFLVVLLGLMISVAINTVYFICVTLWLEFYKATRENVMGYFKGVGDVWPHSTDPVGTYKRNEGQPVTRNPPAQGGSASGG